MTELINRKTDVDKRSARGAADGAEATPTPQQRAVIERYLKRRDSRPGAPRLIVKSKPNQPLEVSQLQPADSAGLALAFGTTEAAMSRPWSKGRRIQNYVSASGENASPNRKMAKATSACLITCFR
jgi:hypothetical protein